VQEVVANHPFTSDIVANKKAKEAAKLAERMSYPEFCEAVVRVVVAIEQHNRRKKGQWPPAGGFSKYGLGDGYKNTNNLTGKDWAWLAKELEQFCIRIKIKMREELRNTGSIS